MSEIAFFHTTTSAITPAKISLELLPNGHIQVDWKDLPKYQNVRQYVIHYKSLNTNQVRKFFLFLVLRLKFH